MNPNVIVELGQAACRVQYCVDIIKAR